MDIFSPPWFISSSPLVRHAILWIKRARVLWKWENRCLSSVPNLQHLRKWLYTMKLPQKGWFLFLSSTFGTSVSRSYTRSTLLICFFTIQLPPPPSISNTQKHIKILQPKSHNHPGFLQRIHATRTTRQGRHPSWHPPPRSRVSEVTEGGSVAK